jgi:hypothetical protein
MKRNPAGLGVVETKESEYLINGAYDAKAALIDAGEGIEIEIDRWRRWEVRTRIGS